jgi:hypothetical protein
MREIWSCVFLVILLVLHGLSCADEVPDVGSLVPDGGFEKARAGQVPEGWVWQPAPGSEVSCRVVSVDPRDGAQCVELTAEKGTGTLCLKVGPIEPMMEYQLTLWIRSEKNDTQCWFGGGREDCLKNPIYAGPYEWTRRDSWFRAGPGETSLDLSVTIVGSAKLWIDDVRLVRMCRSSDPCWQPKLDPLAKEQITARLEPIREEAPKLRSRLDGLRKAGAHTDYAQIPMSVVEDFLPRIGLRAGDPKYAQACTVMITELERVTADLKADLQALEANPKCVPRAWRYRTGRIETHGYAQMGDAVNPATGKVVRRPVIFTGYGCFFTVVDKPEMWQPLGGNLVATEMGPNSIPSALPGITTGDLPNTVTRAADGTMRVSEKNIDLVVHRLNEAARNNVAVLFLISPHYMPPFGGWPSCYADHPAVRDILEAYLRTLIPRIKDIPSLHSIILTNEPAAGADAKDAALVRGWRGFLRDRYGRIDKLNEAYGSQHKAFWEVPMPPAGRPWAYFYTHQQRPWFHDWSSYNAERFAQWHEWLAGLIHEMAPNLPVHAKLTGGYLMGWGLPMADGVDPELYAPFTQYIGYDNVGGVRMIYDLMSSFQKAPAVNSEDHILNPDGNYLAFPHPRRFYIDLFAAAMHGQFASAVWAYEPNCEPMSLWDFSIRPAGMVQIGRCGLDLMRVAPAMAAIQDVPREVAILYSPTSFYCCGDEYFLPWRAAWEAFFSTGLRIRFLSERQLQAGDFGDTRLLILPGRIVVKPETLEGLAKFAAGRKIVTIGPGVEYTTPGWTPVDRKRIDSVVSKRLDPENPAWRELLVRYVRKSGIRPEVELMREGGKPAEGIHWLCGELDDRKVAAFVNLTGRAVKLTLSTPKARKVRDLVADQEITLPATVEHLGTGVWMLPE